MFMASSFKEMNAIQVAQYIVGQLEPKIVNRMIARQYKDATPEEIDQIQSDCCKLLSGDEANLFPSAQLSRRLDGIARKAEVVLAEYEHLDIDGFITFRLQGYKAELEDAVAYAVEEYVSNKHYKEFISLLQYFVHVQAIKISEVHLVHEGGNRYQILDQHMRQIAFAEENEVVVETVDRDLNYEDRILSTLISTSPHHIYVHTNEPDTLSIKTIAQIFEGRTTICNSCDRCKRDLTESESLTIMNKSYHLRSE
jgi:putative sporulation protein YtxC